MVTVSVPARFLATVLEDCASVGALNVHVFTSGFSETSTTEGVEMEKVVREVATRNGIRVVGPNCLGVHSPAAQFSTIGDITNRSGSAAFVAQSGGHAMDFIFRAADVGIGVSKVISFGNALVLESADYLEFLGQDESTNSIGMYIEGVRNGPKLLKLAREINPRKPVIIWKGGLSVSGSRAAASHTGSLAGQGAIWDAFFRQTGAVRAGSVEEVVDVMQAFNLLPAPRSNRLAMIGSGGGNSVAASDICSEEGLDMAELSSETSALLREFIPDAGNSVRNPVDLSFMANVRDKQQQAARLVTADPSIDMLLMIPSLNEYTDVTSEPEKALPRTSQRSLGTIPTASLSSSCCRSASGSPHQDGLSEAPEGVLRSGSPRLHIAAQGLPVSGQVCAVTTCSRDRLARASPLFPGVRPTPSSYPTGLRRRTSAPTPVWYPCRSVPSPPPPC